MADLSDEDIEFIQELREAREEEHISKRDVLKALGMVGAGGVVGATGAGMATQNVKADASTTDSDGDVGAPTDPVDVFADGVDATSVNTDKINSTEYITPSDGLGSTLSNASSNTRYVVLPGSYQESAFSVASVSDIEVVFAPGAVFEPTSQSGTIITLGDVDNQRFIDWYIDESNVSGGTTWQISGGGNNIRILNPTGRNIEGSWFNCRTNAGEGIHLLGHDVDLVNNSGFINIFEGQDIVISDYRATGSVDAGIDVKARNAAVRDVSIGEGLIAGGASGIGFGTEIANNVTNVSVSGMICEDVRRPIFLKPQEGGNIRNCDVSVIAEDEDGSDLLNAVYIDDNNSASEILDSDFSVRARGQYANYTGNNGRVVAAVDGTMRRSTIDIDWHTVTGTQNNPAQYINLSPNNDVTLDDVTVEGSFTGDETTNSIAIFIDGSATSITNLTIDMDQITAIDSNSNIIDINNAGTGGTIIFDSVRFDDNTGVARQDESIRFDECEGVDRAALSTPEVIVNQFGEGNFGGASPDPTAYGAVRKGDTLSDADNRGDMYYVFDADSSSGVTQIGT